MRAPVFHAIFKLLLTCVLHHSPLLFIFLFPLLRWALERAGVFLTEGREVKKQKIKNYLITVEKYYLTAV